MCPSIVKVHSTATRNCFYMMFSLLYWVERTCPVFLMREARSLRRDCSWDPPPSSISNLARSNSLKSSSRDACSLLALRLERSRLNSYNQPNLINTCIIACKAVNVQTSIYDLKELMQ